MKTNFLKAICGLTLIALTPSALTGCCTTLTLQKAKGSSHTDKKGKTIVDEKPEPAANALLPLAVIGDIATLPLWVVVTIAVNLGLIHPSRPIFPKGDKKQPTSPNHALQRTAPRVTLAAADRPATSAHPAPPPFRSQRAALRSR